MAQISVTLVFIKNNKLLHLLRYKDITMSKTSLRLRRETQ
jgi:hypothetical protein